MEGKSEDLGTERIRGLLKILPSKDEVEMLKSVPREDQERLGAAEKFILRLIQLKGYRLRLEAMLLKEEFESCVSSLESSINTILQATQGAKPLRPSNVSHFNGCSRHLHKGERGNRVVGVEKR